MKKSINVVNQSLTFTFDEGLEPITLAMSAVSPANATYAMLHGFGARIGDNAAISRKQKDGSVIRVTEAMRRDEIAKMVAHYASGTADWELGRTTPIDPRATALATERNIPYAEAQAILAKIEIDAVAAFFAAEQAKKDALASGR